MEHNNSDLYNNIEEEQSINIRELLEFIWRLRWWIVGSAFITLCFAFLYVRMQTPIYERTSWIMMNKNDGNNAELNLLSEFTGRTTTKKIENELFIIKSPTMMSKVVKELDLNTCYYQYQMPVGDRIKLGRALLSLKKVEYYNNSPFELIINRNPLYPSDMQPGSVYIEFKNIKGEQFQVKEFKVNGNDFVEGKNTFNYGDSIPMGAFSVKIKLTGKATEMKDGGKYLCTWNTPIGTARGLVKKMDATVQGKAANQSDVVIITYKDNVPRRAEDILNTLVRIVNQESRDYKNISTQNTIAFIDQRLAVISSELGAAEADYKNYQSSNVVVSLESQTQLAVSSDMDYQKQLTEVQLQLQILDMITKYLAETADGEYKVIPANVGVSDAGLNSIISNYNTLVAERNRMVANSSETNPRVLNVNQQLEDGKKSIELSIANLVKVYGIRENELRKVIGSSQRKMAEIPQQQFELQQISRRMEVIEPLFQLLQQKREEAQISMYSEVDNFRVIESAFGTGVPISPNTKMIMLLAFVLGCCIPPGIVWLRIMMKSKVETKKDIEDNIDDVTVLACLPKNDDTNYALIPKNGRDTTSESFRMLRSNIQYLPGVKVLQVTSSTPGEGKSYVASNLALSISHTGKKVILVGMDLRKPALHKIFPNLKYDMMKSVVGYLIGKLENIDDAIVRSDISDTLDLLPAGPVPPNPTELLSLNKQESLIAYLREKYDYVVIDSAPYLPVSDSFLINTFVDATLYTVRADYTDLKMLTEINEAIKSKSKPMKNVNIVLNGLDLVSNKYRYGYGAGYGYGYGYGHGHGYGYGYGYGYGTEGELSGKSDKKGNLFGLRGVLKRGKKDLKD